MRVLQRKKKKNYKIIVIMLIIAAIITTIWWTIIIKIFKETNITTDNTNNSQFFIWKEVNIEWEITKSDNINLYTNILLLSWTNEKIWLFSKDIDLSIYSWNVQINWIVEDIKSWTPIIDVKDIIVVTNEEINEELTWDTELTTWNNNNLQSKFEFPKYWFSIDFSENTWYKVDIDEEYIYITDSSFTGTDLVWNAIMTISPTKCIIWDAIKDCNKLDTTFKSLWYQNFISSNGMKFYNIWESNSWFYNNWWLWWYYINTKYEKDLVKLSKYISPYTPNTIKAKISSNIPNTCSKKDIKIKETSEIKLNINENEELIWDIVWFDINKNTINCKIQIKLWNPITIKLISISSKNDWIVSSWTNTIISWESITNISTWVTSITTTTWSSINTWIYSTFKSSQWFTMYIPRTLSYRSAWMSWNTDLWISWLTCGYKINMISNKQKDQLMTNPSAEAYLCTSSEDDESLKSSAESNWYIYKKWETSWKTFFIKYNSDTQKAIESIIVE